MKSPLVRCYYSEDGKLGLLSDSLIEEKGRDFLISSTINAQSYIFRCESSSVDDKKHNVKMDQFDTLMIFDGTNTWLCMSFIHVAFQTFSPKVSLSFYFIKGVVL